jgi:hypothetical protein
MKKIIYVMIFAVILVITGVILFGRKESVIFGKVRYGNVFDDISFSGKVRCSMLKKYFFPFNQGEVIDIPKIGKKIKKGETVLNLKCNEIENGYSMAKIEYESSLNKLNNLKITFKEKSRLYKDKLISNDDYNIFKNQFKIAENGLKLAKLKLSNFNDMYNKLNPKAPFEGEVLDRNKNNGENIYKGEYILAFGNRNNLYIESFLSEYDRRRIEVGNNVEISFDYLGNKKYSGTISEISFIKKIQDLREKYRIIIKVNNSDKDILIDSNCNVYLIIKKYENYYYFPEDGLLDDGSKIFYYGIIKHYAYKREIDNIINVKGYILLKECGSKNVILNISDLKKFPKKILIKEKKKVEIKGLL